MSDNDYTPRTGDMRELWKIQFYEGIADDEAAQDAGWDDDRMYAQFDRWLAAHEAVIRTEEQEEKLMSKDVSITDLTARARTWAASPLLTQAGICPLLEDLANTLEAAERDAQQAEDQANNLAGDVVQLEVKLQNAQTTLEMDEKYINKLEGKIARLQAVTVPTEDLAEQTHPFSQSPHMAAKYWAELVRARNRIAELEAAAVPVEPEWEYRVRNTVTGQTSPRWEPGERAQISEPSGGWIEEGRVLGDRSSKWQPVSPDEVTEGGTQ